MAKGDGREGRGCIPFLEGGQVGSNETHFAWGGGERGRADSNPLSALEEIVRHAVCPREVSAYSVHHRSCRRITDSSALLSVPEHVEPVIA